MKLTVERIRLDRGGYDPSGRYYGVGQPLFRVTSGDGQIDFTTRARTAREAADDAARRFGITRSFPRRAPAPKEERARAAAAAAHAEVLVQTWRSGESQSGFLGRAPTKEDDTGSAAYWLRLKARVEAAIDALLVAGDAYEAVGQMSKARSQRSLAKKFSIYPSAYARYAKEAERHTERDRGSRSRYRKRRR